MSRSPRSCEDPKHEHLAWALRLSDVEVSTLVLQREKPGLSSVIKQDDWLLPFRAVLWRRARMANDYELSDMIRDAAWKQCWALLGPYEQPADMLPVQNLQELKNHGVTIDDKRKVWHLEHVLHLQLCIKMLQSICAKTWSCTDGRAGAVPSWGSLTGRLQRNIIDWIVLGQRET